MEFSRDGRFLAIAGGDLHLFRIADGARLSVRAIPVAGKGEGELRALALGGDGRLSGREDAAANIESASGAKPSNSELEAAIDSGLLGRFFADMAPRRSPPP